jgi:transposase InsO family protein
MQLHRNARTTPVTRQLIAQRVVQGHWSYTETAEAFGLSAPTVRKWVARHRAEGLAGLEDRSSRPRRSPTITAPALVTAIQQLRTDHGVPAWLIGRALGVPRSTVSAWLRRLGLHRVRAVAAAVRRYEWPALGDMLHLDIKPLGRIGCVGHRIHGDRRRCARGVGWEYAHVAVDDYSRIAYVEVLPDQHGATCAAFLRRALAWWAHRGVTVQRLLTDNGSGYLSRVFRQTCEQLGVGHRRTRPYMPRTNGKAERFHPDPVARMGVRDGVSRFAHPPPGAPALAAVLQPGTAARESRVRHALVATQRRCLINNVLDHNS